MESVPLKLSLRAELYRADELPPPPPPEPKGPSKAELALKHWMAATEELRAENERKRRNLPF